MAASLETQNIEEQQSDDYAESYARLALSLCEIHQYDQALIDINQAFKLDPNHEGLRLTRGKIFLGKHNLPSALSDLNSYISTNGTDPEAYLELAKTNEELGNSQLASMQRANAAILKKQKIAESQLL